MTPLNGFFFMLKHPLNEGQKLKAVSRWFRWQLGTRLLDTPVIMRWVDDTCLVVSRGETGLTQNIYCGLQDFSEMAFLLHFLRKDDFFMDVGANSGIYSILSAGCCKTRTMAIEPVKSTFKRLDRQIMANNLGSLIDLKNVGLSDKEGKLYFRIDRDTENKIVEASYSGPKEELPVTTLNNITDQTPTLIKVDVEGFDSAVFSGGKNHLRSEKLKALIVELSVSSIPILSDCGFIPCDYDPEKRTVQELRWDGLNGRPNVIAVRDLDFVRSRVESAEQRRFHNRLF